MWKEFVELTEIFYINLPMIINIDIKLKRKKKKTQIFCLVKFQLWKAVKNEESLMSHFLKEQFPFALICKNPKAYKHLHCPCTLCTKNNERYN